MSTRHLFDYMERKGYDFQSSQGCVEPSYDDKPVILANWNNIPDKVFDSLENHGFSCEWEDEWIECDNCYKVFRSSPDSYSWEMFGHVFDGYAVCGDCLKDDPDEYFELLENHPRMAVTTSLWDVLKDTIEERYTLVKDGFENGFHPGQNDDPTKILESLRKNDQNGIYIFVIDGQGQFDIEFSVYRKNESTDDE